MSVHTTYDSMRDNLRNKLNECLQLSKEMLDEDIWGYDEMKNDYAIELYVSIKKAKDMV